MDTKTISEQQIEKDYAQARSRSSKVLPLAIGVSLAVAGIRGYQAVNIPEITPIVKQYHNAHKSLDIFEKRSKVMQKAVVLPYVTEEIKSELDETENSLERAVERAIVKVKEDIQNMENSEGVKTHFKKRHEASITLVRGFGEAIGTQLLYALGATTYLFSKKRKRDKRLKELRGRLL